MNSEQSDYRARLATEIRSALGEFNDESEAVVTLVKSLADKARALEQPESRAITALKVTLLGVECYLPASIAKAVQERCEQPASAAGVEGWMPIDTAPRDGRMLVLFWNGAWCPGFYLDNSHTQFPWAGWRVPSGQLTPPGQPTHYMEPAAPKPEDAS